MKDLLLTTALISLIAAVPIHAQTSTGNATTGADTTTTGSDAATDDSGGTGSTTDTVDTGTVAGDTAMDTTSQITPPEGYTEYDRTALTSEDLQGATVYDANGESVGEIAELVMATNATGGAASTEMSQTTDTEATDMADAPTGSTTTDGTAAGDSGVSLSVDGQVSHVVLDVGGFLGIGAHSVAVPMDALQVFRDANEDLRVYLPWTEAQLEALPEYNADDPSTLGSMDQPTGSTDMDTTTDTMGGTDTSSEGAEPNTTNDATGSDATDTTTEGSGSDTSTDGTSN